MLPFEVSFNYWYFYFPGPNYCNSAVIPILLKRDIEEKKLASTNSISSMF